LCSALFPCTPPSDELVRLAMRNTDLRISQDKPVTPGFLLAVLLWRDFEARRGEFEGSRRPAEARASAASAALADEQEIIAIPRRFTQFIRDVWALQLPLEGRRPRAIGQAFGHERFRAAYDFLVLRAEASEPVREAADWWTRYQELDTPGRTAMVEDMREKPAEGKTGKRRKRRRRRRPAEPSAETESGSLD
jgi:poly(A) polymerase